MSRTKFIPAVQDNTMSKFYLGQLRLFNHYFCW